MAAGHGTSSTPGSTGQRPVVRGLSLLLVAGATASLLAAAGCSISTSVSDSVSSPFKWSSDSSKSSTGEREESYRGDVRDYTEAYVRSGNDVAAYRKGLTSIATKHGITNWEADDSTYIGIGEGLGKAQVTSVQLEVYKTNLSEGDPVKASSIQKGYEKYRNR